MRNIKPATALNQRRRLTAPAKKLQEVFVVNLEHGLHARPCALLVKTLRPFRSDVEVQLGDQKANGQSIMGVMALAACNKSALAFTITGPDAPEAMEAVRRLFETGFEDAYHTPIVHSLSS